MSEGAGVQRGGDAGETGGVRQSPDRSRLALYLFILITLLVLMACQANTPTSPRLAAHTIRPDDPSLARTQAAGFDTVVQLFPRREVESTRDQFHWEVTDQFVAGAEYYGLDVIVRLDQYPAWASQVDPALNAPPHDLRNYYNFAYRVAERYRGRVKAYIIWNEPNLAVEWGGQRPNPTAFTELLKEGYQAGARAYFDVLESMRTVLGSRHRPPKATASIPRFAAWPSCARLWSRMATPTSRSGSPRWAGLSRRRPIRQAVKHLQRFTSDLEQQVRSTITETEEIRQRLDTEVSQEINALKRTREDLWQQLQRL